MCTLDNNFDGRISYAELKKHIEKLGFDLRVMENGANKKKANATNEEFIWRDKAIELIIRSFNNKFNKKMSIAEYFK